MTTPHCREQIEGADFVPLNLGHDSGFPGRCSA
jgi:hypothetical protein